jgi:hypothetical protein
MQIQIIRSCSVYSLESSLDSRVIFGLYSPFRVFLMMYFDADIHMTMDSWSALTLSVILVLYTITCFIYIYIYIYIYEKLCKFVYNGLDSHGCT